MKNKSANGQDVDVTPIPGMGSSHEVVDSVLGAVSSKHFKILSGAVASLLAMSIWIVSEIQEIAQERGDGFRAEVTQIYEQRIDEVNHRLDNAIASNAQAEARCDEMVRDLRIQIADMQHQLIDKLEIGD